MNIAGSGICLSVQIARWWGDYVLPLWHAAYWQRSGLLIVSGMAIGGNPWV
jgi:hypothetical protein